MNLDLVRPCSNCPFRTDIRPFLRFGRVLEIVNGLLDHQQSFTCHKTVDYGDDEPREDPAVAQHCAGALIFLEHLERPNQIMRWFERIGGYDRTKLDMTAPVYRSKQAILAAHSDRDLARRTKARRTKV